MLKNACLVQKEKVEVGCVNGEQICNATLNSVHIGVGLFWLVVCL